MNADELRAIQAPLKEKYRSDPASASVTLRAESRLSHGIACKVATGNGLLEAGLHPATGGDGTQLCSGDMLLEALAACAGVTLRAVATAMEIPLHDFLVRAEGDLDFRGTLGVSKEVPVGFQHIRLTFDLRSDAPEEKLAKLIELTQRYCVVLQTLRTTPTIVVSHRQAQ
jgi:uncharacterized OsmC-like protein